VFTVNSTYLRRINRSIARGLSGAVWAALVILLLNSLACTDSDSSFVLPDGGLHRGFADSGVFTIPTSTSCELPGESAGPFGWEAICNQAPVGHFLGVWGAGVRDVYTVGGVPSSSDQVGSTAIWHYTGDRFEKVSSPGKERAWWVFGYSSDEVFVFGENGLGLRLEEGEFKAFDTGTNQTIYGAWGPNPDILYFVSGDFFAADGRGRVHVLTSSGARELSDPVLTAYEGKALFKVWGTSENDVFVAGERGTIFHFDGNAWSKSVTPSDTTPILTLSGRNSGEVYGVGGRGRGTVWRYDGSDWGDITPASGLDGVMGVHTGPDLPVLISGENGLLATISANSVLSEGLYTDQPLHSVWQDEEGGAWAVGGNLLQVGREALGIVLRRTAAPCSSDAIRAPGYHHLDLQGRGAQPKSDGSYHMYDVSRGTIHPDLVHGEHYLLGPGAFVEFSHPLCADITDNVAFRMPNNDEPGAVAFHQLFVVRGGNEMLIAEAIDDEPGNMGYLPFNRSSLPVEERARVSQTRTHPVSQEQGWAEFANAPPFEQSPQDLWTRRGDTLLYRVTNISDFMYGLMIWFPQNGLEYQAFLEIEVPTIPGGEVGLPTRPPPTPGPCAVRTSSQFIELGKGETSFEAYPPQVNPVEIGPQGSLMFMVAVRGDGFTPGDSTNPLSPTNPLLVIRLALDAPPGHSDARIIADGLWQRGFRTQDGRFVLTGVRPTVPVGAAIMQEVAGHVIYAETILVDGMTGVTLCEKTTFTAIQ